MKYFNIILGMALVTYLPRLLPLLFLTDKQLNPRLENFLQYIPLTSLSILLVRGVLTSSKELLIPSMIGILLAGIVSYFKENLILAVLISIISSFLVINII